MDQQSTLDMNVGDSMPPRSMSLPSEGIEEIETLNNLVISDSGGGDEGGDRGDEVERGFRVPGAGDQGDGGLGDKQEVAKQPRLKKNHDLRKLQNLLHLELVLVHVLKLSSWMSLLQKKWGIINYLKQRKFFLHCLLI